MISRWVCEVARREWTCFSSFFLPLSSAFDTTGNQSSWYNRQTNKFTQCLKVYLPNICQLPRVICLNGFSSFLWLRSSILFKPTLICHWPRRSMPISQRKWLHWAQEPLVPGLWFQVSSVHMRHIISPTSMYTISVSFLTLLHYGTLVANGWSTRHVSLIRGCLVHWLFLPYPSPGWFCKKITTPL